VTANRLEIQKLSGTIGGGTLALTGGVTYRPDVQYNLAVTGRGIRFHIPDGVREGLDTDLALTGTKDSGVIRGQVRLNEVSFANDFDLTNIVGIASGSNPGVASAFSQSQRLDIAVVSTSDLDLSNSKLSLQGAANLRVQGTMADPIMLGHINLTGGDLLYRGSRYILQPSTIDFVNPYQLEPRLNVNVDTKVDQYNLHMLFRGTPDHLSTTYTSDPALPPADVINLLVFGKTTEAEAANPVPGNVGAESMIASSVTGQITNRIEKVAGFSQLSVDPVLKDNQQNPGARVTIQQRVTGNLFVTFATDVTATEREIVKLEYQVSPKVSVSGVRDQNGGFALDLRIHKVW
jgi:translocation and assembly module TamB